MLDKSNQRIRNMFGQIAGKYDLMNHLLSCQVDRYWRWRTVRLARPTGTAPILDVCTGTGDLAFAYWKVSAGHVPIVAADFCHEMLQVGISKKRRMGINGQVEFVEADTQRLPFPDDQFQIVSVAFGLRNVADTDRGLDEMLRVTRPGGHVAILEFSQPQLQPLKGIYHWYFRHVLPRVGQWMARNDHEAYDYLPASVGQFPSGQALADRMTAAGMQNVWFRPLTVGIATLYVGQK